jgi:1,3-beta-galactosyl-N-acetylhexosamine phosphorylase
MGEASKLTGHFTLPAQKGMEQEVRALCEKWGADVVRDSDGTALSPEILGMGRKVYSTVCLIRADQEWAKAHPGHCQQKYLMSRPVTSRGGEELHIPLQDGYSKEQFRVDADHDPRRYWEVIDRTTGIPVETQGWRYEPDGQEVIVCRAQPWHVYTVNFLVYQIWETTSMYNYITNNWSGEHQVGIDPRQPETRQHLLAYLKRWLSEHPHTDCVRFTSMVYQFPLIKNERRENVYLDWSGYLDPVSAVALDEFERKHGYRLRSEDIVDEGYFNASYRVPKGPYLDWMKFTQDFVRGFTKECVERVHQSGKKAMLFFCDHWIGTEPYQDGFEKLGFDGIAGPCLSGVELRRISDVPGNAVKEVRLYPYFFEVNLQDEPVFSAGGDPVRECKRWWKGIRRALLRRCVDRIGFGGYLHLAVKYPAFLDYVEQLATEFRTVLARTQKTSPYGLTKKVALLDCWGRMRSWMHNDNWPQGHIPEFLSGFPGEIEFLSFDDVRRHGIGDDTAVVINWGRAGSAWSGGPNWIEPRIAEALREWVDRGGGFIGVEDPTACEHQGRFFQLADVLGVEKEIGNSLAWAKNVRPQQSRDHFILQDVDGPIDLGAQGAGVYLARDSAELLAGAPDGVQLSTNTFGRGRAVYLSSYLHTPQNMRLLHRAILWASGQETALRRWFTSDTHTDCAFYPEVGQFVVVNNCEQECKTTIYDGQGGSASLALAPLEMRWLTLDELGAVSGR